MVSGQDTDELQNAAGNLALRVQGSEGGSRGVDHYDLGPVGIHREFITAAARWIMEAKLWSVLSARMATP